MMFLLLAFQAVTFTIHKCSRGQDAPAASANNTSSASGNNPYPNNYNTRGYGNNRYGNGYSSNSSNYSRYNNNGKYNRNGKYNSNGKYGSGRGKESAQLFPFNPNTVSLDSLTLLGFSVKQAQTILRYREKGGRFRRKEDLAKIYTVSPEMYERLYPYITLPTTAHATTTNNNTNINIPPPQSKQFSTGQDKQYNNSNGLNSNRFTNANSIGKENTKNIFNSDSSNENQMAGGKNYQTALTRQTGQAQDGLARQARQRRPAGQKSGYQESWGVQVDLNEADSAALIEVKGIGPYFCKKILELRERLGSFASTHQLLEIKGMDEEKFERIKGQVFVHPSGIKRFKLTEADKRFLARHPYIGAYNARGIALFAEAMGKDSCTLSNLVKNNILSPEAAEKLKPYVIEP